MSSKTDDECIKLAKGEYGIDAQEALLNILEKKLCIDIIKRIQEDNLTTNINL